jgi:hypothetical protein
MLVLKGKELNDHASNNGMHPTAKSAAFSR